MRARSFAQRTRSASRPVAWKLIHGWGKNFTLIRHVDGGQHQWWQRRLTNVEEFFQRTDSNRRAAVQRR
jgi:hypothetical protein